MPTWACGRTLSPRARARAVPSLWCAADLRMAARLEKSHRSSRSEARINGSRPASGIPAMLAAATAALASCFLNPSVVSASTASRHVRRARPRGRSGCRVAGGLAHVGDLHGGIVHGHLGGRRLPSATSPSSRAPCPRSQARPDAGQRDGRSAEGWSGSPARARHHARGARCDARRCSQTRDTPESCSGHRRAASPGAASRAGSSRLRAWAYRRVSRSSPRRKRRSRTRRR